MGTTALWPTIHAERKALADDLSGLAEEQWSGVSLCTSWTIRDVLAHMTATATMTPASFFAKLAGAGFKFERVQQAGVAHEQGQSPADTLARFAAVQTSVKHPPGPADTMLGETLIHAEDIRRPLGLTRDYPLEAVVRVADFFKGSNMIIGAKNRIAGLSLRATDADWRRGTGPEVEGPIMSLVLAMTGRGKATDDLSGEGVATLKSRARS